MTKFWQLAFHTSILLLLLLSIYIALQGVQSASLYNLYKQPWKVGQYGYSPIAEAERQPRKSGLPKAASQAHGWNL